MKILREHVEALYHVLSENLGQTPEAFHLDDFKLRERELYYKGKSRPLMMRGGGGGVKAGWCHSEYIR